MVQSQFLLCVLKPLRFIRFKHTSHTFFPLSCREYGDKIAIHDGSGSHSYHGLLRKSQAVTFTIEDLLEAKAKDVTVKKQRRIAILCPNDATYVVAQWATWFAGHVAVPLQPRHPESLLRYFIEDSQSSIVLTTKKLLPLIEPFVGVIDDLKTVIVDLVDDVLVDGDLTLASTAPSPSFYEKASALILYTSGTTGLPKGVVLTHANVKANVDNMVAAWGWTKNDTILHCLPLHHTHGVLNALICPLSVGAKCMMLEKFDSAEVWDKLVSVDPDSRITVFMAVPTIYALLLEEYDKRFGKSPSAQQFIKAFCEQNIRLMVSGSSALPIPVYERWEETTGHRLLERYGMTEIGMVLTNPLDGMRRPGFVGMPFPQVQLRIAKKNFYIPSQYEVIAEATSKGTVVKTENQDGELLVKGATVFKEYYNRPEATQDAFTKDGWFATGDTVAYVDGMFKIQGRTSVDIIKSGGYKISALDVEFQLLRHPKVVDCVVVGIADPVWGQKVAAVLVQEPGKKPLTLDGLQEWCKEKMAPYMIPTVLRIVQEIPRNVMGKVNKKELLKQMFEE